MFILALLERSVDAPRNWRSLPACQAPSLGVNPAGGRQGLFRFEAKLTTYDPKTRSKWIQLVRSNPHLLYEERKQESFDLMEELFEEFSWIPEKYVQMGPDSFMSRYCW